MLFAFEMVLPFSRANDWFRFFAQPRSLRSHPLESGPQSTA
jgi:hypothetical protein